MGARKIDDFGGYAKDSDGLMKSKAHLKRYESVEGAGGIKDYPDSPEEIARDQKAGDAKIKGRPMKAGYRY